ncbi:MAG: kynureninase [Saprospiraceae bacterium]|nr:kynureninase [Saprospiraceae bacterium]MDW8483666.1 kynureninase [Saprospiraceae bacterium]
MEYQNTLDFARQMDVEDPLRHYRREFLFPQHDGHPALYFCGNSLGLQPKAVRQRLLEELDQWAELAVEGHFRGRRPWMHYHKFLTPQTARLVGALPHEVVVMNTLTTNLHLMMVSFYRPTPQRYRILMEAGAFPSDQYAVESQVRWHGFDPEDAIIEVAPRAGEDVLHTCDIERAIEQAGDSLALVLFGGVNYYSGQWYDLPAITAAAHRVGAYAGFDLAHAAGNVPLRLHEWGADFAVWCSYKYLNSGPGGPSGVFVHERHGNDPNLPRFAGWWGHSEEERFLMRKGFKPMRGAEGWQLSNAQILSFAAHLASLELFDAAGMEALRAKSLRLTGYLEYVLDEARQRLPNLHIITPRDPAMRGCQLSVRMGDQGKALFEYLSARGVMADWREPDVIRLAPVPLYNSFEDVWRLGALLREWPGA